MAVAKQAVKLALGTHKPGTFANAGGWVGKRAGYGFGSAGTGQWLGRQLGQTFANITGRGDYSTVARSIMPAATAYAPQMRSKMNDVVVSRSEYIGDLVSGPNMSGSSTEFNIQGFVLNPGLHIDEGGAFSWLNVIAAGFQQYQMRKCVFEYRPTSGNATGSNTTLGSVIMAADYNPANPEITTSSSKLELLNSQWAISASPDKCILFPVECAKRDEQMQWHDVRTGPLQSTENANLTDMCNLIVATQGMQTASQNLGELHIVYTVAFSKFRTNSPSNTIPTAHYFIQATSAYTNAAPFGACTSTTTTPAAYPANNLLLTFATDGTAGYIGFPATVWQTDNTYEIRMSWKGTSTSSLTAPVLAASGCELAHVIWQSGNTPTYNFSTNPTSASQFHSVAYIKMNGSALVAPSGFTGNIQSNQPYVQVGACVLPTSGTALDICVTQVNTDALPDQS